MKAVAAVAVIAAIALVWYLRRPSPAATAAAPPAPVASAATPGAPSATPARPPQHVTRLSPDQRREVADRIAAAQATRSGAAAVRAPARPSLPDRPATLDPDDVDSFKTTVRSAMHEVIPMITDCYDKAIPTLPPGELKLAASFTLTGDPDVGTLIDAKQLAGGNGTPLPAAFDDCLRSTLQSLELPPLVEGNEVNVTYPFVFRPI